MLSKLLPHWLTIGVTSVQATFRASAHKHASAPLNIWLMWP